MPLATEFLMKFFTGLLFGSAGVWTAGARADVHGSTCIRGEYHRGEGEEEERKKAAGEEGRTTGSGSSAGRTTHLLPSPEQSLHLLAFVSVATFFIKFFFCLGISEIPIEVP